MVGLSVIYNLFYARDLLFLGLQPALHKDPASFVDAAHLYSMSYYFFTFLGLPFTREPFRTNRRRHRWDVVLGRILGELLGADLRGIARKQPVIAHEGLDGGSERMDVHRREHDAAFAGAT